MLKWIARAVFIVPPLSLFALMLYSNYKIWSDLDHVAAAWAVVGIGLDVIALIAGIVLGVSFGDVVADFFRWLWRNAEWSGTQDRRSRSREE